MTLPTLGLVDHELDDYQASCVVVAKPRPRGERSPGVVIAGGRRWHPSPPEPKRVGRVVVPWPGDRIRVGQDLGILVGGAGRVVIAGCGRCAGRIFLSDWKHEAIYGTAPLRSFKRFLYTGPR